MTISTVRSFFESAINTWAKSQSPAIPVAYENIPFIKPSSGNYLECWYMPAATVARTVGANKDREVGIYQVNVWTPEGIGTGSGMSLAQSIINLFPMVPKGSVSIEKPPAIEKSFTDVSGWYITPVIIHYRHENY